MLKRTLAAFAVLLVSLGVAHAQPGATTGGIRGKIVVPEVGFGERIEVLIERVGEEGQVFQVLYTDSLGNYFINGLPLGSYNLVVKLDGYKTFRERVDMGNPNSGANIPTFNVILSKNEPQRAKSESKDIPDVVDIAELRRTFPKKAVEAYEKAQEEDRKGNLARAVERLQEAVRLAPDFYSAHTFL